jgi:hypothetical protein
LTLWQIQSEHFDIKWRLLYLAAGIAAFILSFAAGAGLQLSDEEAKQISDDFIERVQGIGGEGIFSNNAVIGLGMFIPAAGAGIGVYSAYSTGIVFNAFAHITPALSGVPPLSVFATPFAILELFAYGLGISRSGMLVHDLAKRKSWKQYLPITGIEIVIVIAALLIGSAIESQSLAQITE